MKLFRKALALGFAVAAASAAACSAQNGTGGSTHGTNGQAGVVGENGGNTGAVGLHLNIPNSSFTIGSLNWQITNGTNNYTGTINMTDDAGNAAQSIEFVAGPVLAGTGYTVTLTGSDSNGDPCVGTSPPFAVSAGTSTTAQAVVNVTCTVPTDAALGASVETGSVAVDAGVTLVNQAAFQCPGITGVAISPAELHPPESAAISAGVTGSVGGTPTLLWTATCNGAGTPTIANPTAASTTFGCGTAVPATGVEICTLTLTVGLDGTGADGGNVGQVCTGIANTTISESITCEPGGIVLPSCSAGETQCGTTTSDCENLSNGSGPNGLCGSTCASATKCGTGQVCTNGVCGTPPASACTAALAAANGGACPSSGPGSIKCTGNGTTTGICTSTEAYFVNLDTTKTCYTCLQSNFCLDNSSQKGFECDDLTASFTNGAGTAATGSTSCLSTLQCITGTTGNNCANSTYGVNDCYCGDSDEPSTTCSANTSQAGNCLTSELAGFAYTPGSTQATTILGEFTTQSQPSGMANALAACATGNNCTTCILP